MKTAFPHRPNGRVAFTLIELLVVIAIMAVLAGLLLPAGIAVRNKGLRNRAKTELTALETAINSYRADKGHFPPDNPNDTITWVNQLFYELRGTEFNGTQYQLKGGQAPINAADFAAFFGGPAVGGFINTTKGAGEESTPARDYFKELPANRYLEIEQNGRDGTILGTSLRGPLMLNNGAGKEINPWRYRISGPDRHNPESFDLWVDILISGKTNRISNWSDNYEVVP